MIELMKINGSIFYINPELVETMEAYPDTTIMLTNGKVFVVRNSIEEVRDKIIAYKRRLVNFDN